MTYSSSFEKVISQLDGWIKTPIKQKVIVYSGDYENLNGNVKLINYKHIANIFLIEKRSITRKKSIFATLLTANYNRA